MAWNWRMQQACREPRGGFADLREEEKERLLTVNASLAKEIAYVLREAAFTVKSLSFSSSLRSAKASSYGMKAFYTFRCPDMP